MRVGSSRGEWVSLNGENVAAKKELAGNQEGIKERADEGNRWA